MTPPRGQPRSRMPHPARGMNIMGLPFRRCCTPSATQDDSPMGTLSHMSPMSSSWSTACLSPAATNKHSSGSVGERPRQRRPCPCVAVCRAASAVLRRAGRPGRSCRVGRPRRAFGRSARLERNTSSMSSGSVSEILAKCLRRSVQDSDYRSETLQARVRKRFRTLAKSLE